MSVLINNLSIILVEVSIYVLFVFIVFTKTTGEICRRWKVSVFVSVVFGLIYQTIFFGLCFIGWIMKLEHVGLINSLMEYILDFIPALLGLFSLIIMPIIIVGTFIAYYRFENTGDLLIEKYWTNPKIYYGNYPKPPLL